ncbi:uncharacterized protein LOC124933600 isoform X2 [Impatiens glandulifera]|uniref:uncharacterized protein LOC124933600 isoform X2 n=1 Tax=Impatiens glandulifera TaxID=253017 RepID=UPI001FB10EEB|nr:uncharacterized protein LOC124933600 isoform X2 [Impatiens glandulifera]
MFMLFNFIVDILGEGEMQCMIKDLDTELRKLNCRMTGGFIKLVLTEQKNPSLCKFASFLSYCLLLLCILFSGKACPRFHNVAGGKEHSVYMPKEFFMQSSHILAQQGYVAREFYTQGVEQASLQLFLKKRLGLLGLVLELLMQATYHSAAMQNLIVI